MRFKILSNGSVTDPIGFTASGMHCGIKKSFRKLDTALIVSDVPAVAAGTFTTSRVKAWPLYHDLRIMKRAKHRVIFANSGNANCFNGRTGAKAVTLALELLKKELKIPKREIFIASTGIIGKAFPVKKIERAIPQLVEDLSRDGGHDAARGILTTDTVPKEMSVRFLVDRKPVTLSVMAKGAGMVNPEMNAAGVRAGSLNGRHATMLCYVTTDANITKHMLQKAVSASVDVTFNRLVIDNDQSTNDMVVALANARAGNRKIVSQDSRYTLFQEALTHVFAYVARELARDGEGVQHVCEIVVKGARSKEDSDRLGRQIASSMLFKTMLAGEDPNWGRLMGCVGASGVDYSPKLNIAFDGVPVLVNGREKLVNRRRVRQILKNKEYQLEVNLKKGNSTGRFWATDLTKFYVWINSSYSS
jgi:glutamate N-acetyltransferase / amino-acid N-acetyltransferase